MAVLYRLPSMVGAFESTGVLRQQKLSPKLVVLCAFDRGEDGQLHPAFDAREMPDERRAILYAKQIAHLHDGVIAWSRVANPAVGEFGPSEVLFQCGSIPDLD